MGEAFLCIQKVAQQHRFADSGCQYLHPKIWSLPINKATKRGLEKQLEGVVGAQGFHQKCNMVFDVSVLLVAFQTKRNGQLYKANNQT